MKDILVCKEDGLLKNRHNNDMEVQIDRLQETKMNLCC